MNRIAVGENTSHHLTNYLVATAKRVKEQVYKRMFRSLKSLSDNVDNIEYEEIVKLEFRENTS